MIPKKIHYCWFGEKKLPESVKKFITSWEKNCPDYEIIQWNESNYDVHKIPYISEAYQSKKYAFVSDYARLDIVYHHGGFYLDTDVELIKSLDSFLNEECFMGLEAPGRVNTGLGFGGKKKSEFLKQNMDEYSNTFFRRNGRENLTTCVEYTANALKHNKNFNSMNSIQKLENITIYPTEYFCPYNLETRKVIITDNTISIHHYEASWYGENQIKKAIKKGLLPYKIFLKRKIDTKFGLGTYNKLKENLFFRKR